MGKALPIFCKYCGSRLEKVKYEDGFDEYTGEQKYVEVLECQIFRILRERDKEISKYRESVRREAREYNRSWRGILIGKQYIDYESWHRIDSVEILEKKKANKYHTRIELGQS